MSTSGAYLSYFPEQEFFQTVQEITPLMNHLSDALNQYSEIMAEVSETAVKSGAIHDAAEAFRSRINQLIEITEGTGQKYQSLILDLMGRVSNTDHFLYSSSFAVRDYSQEMYEHLIECLDHPWCNLTDSIGDWFVDKLNKGFKFFGIDLIDQLRKSSHKDLLDYYDTTEADLKVLFDAEQNIDVDFGRTDTGKLSLVEHVLYETNEILRIMAEIIEPGKGNFTAANINRKLNGKFKALQKDFDKVMAIPELDTPSSVNDIARFVEIPFVGAFFLSFDSCAGMFVSDLNGWDAAGMVIFQMFGIAETSIMEGDYNTYAFKKQIMGMLEDFIENDRYSDYGLDEDIDNMRTGVKTANKVLKKGYDYLHTHRFENGRLMLDGRTKIGKQYNQTMDSLDKAGKYLKYGSEALDYISRVSADYSKGLAYLESLKSNYEGNPKLQQALEEIEELYNKEFEAWAVDFVKNAEELGIDYVKGAVAKANPVGAVLSGIEMGLDLGGEITGLGTQAKETYNALTCYNLNTDLDVAYKNAIEKFSNADPSAENYEALAEDVRNCFELRKKNTIDMFKHMAEASSGDKKSYYKYCQMEAEKVTMRDQTTPKLISYDEYLKVYGSGGGGGHRF